MILAIAADTFGQMEKGSIESVITECIAAKRAANLRPIYVRELARFWGKFAEGRETMPIASQDVAQLDRWLSMFSHPSTRATAINRLSALFSFAYRRGYVDRNPADRLERPRIDRRPPRILSPEESTSLMSTCLAVAPEMLAAFALGLYAGIRPAELARLEWSSVDLARGLVRIDAAASKIRRRRIVRLEAIALRWLALAPSMSGRVQPRQARRRRRRIERAIGWEKWPHDLLRHTAASYLLALHQDAGKVSLWLGNSPGILLRHYHELVSPEDCARFWSMEPVAK